MRVIILLSVCLLSTAHAAPQLLTFKDGKVGVNFGGYHAEAGLGGLLTGNAAHGGLSASAGTPYGQNAAAGLGGSVDGRSSGFGYAGAQATPSVGASAVLGGAAGESGFLGSEAYANGKALTKTISTSSNDKHYYKDSVESGPPLAPPPPPHTVAVSGRSDFVQKIKPSKKHTLIKNEDSKAENADRTLMASRGTPTAAAATTTTDASGTNPATMIHVHRQRMRERRRLHQQQQDTQNELDRRRTSEQRARTRQRLQQRQHVAVVHNSVEPTSNDVTASQRSIDGDGHAAVHSNHLSKSFHKSVETQTFAQLPEPPAGPSSGGVYVEKNGQKLYNIFNIPIGILKTIQESLSGIPAQQYSG